MNILGSYRPESKHPPENRLKKYWHDDSLVFLLRHGQITGSEEKRYIGITDVCLDNTGLAQAGYWKQAFSSIPLDSIYSSSLQRCVHTASLIAGDQPVTIHSSLNEINMGTWDGRTFDEINTRYPGAFKKRGEYMDTFRAPLAENFHDLSSRVLPFFDRCVHKRREKILIVTHAGVIRVILSHILNLELKNLFQISVPYGELFVLQRLQKI